MNVLCVVAHPDDEVLGCGGTLAKHADRGDNVSCVFVCHTRALLGSKAASAALGLGPIVCNYGRGDQQLSDAGIGRLAKSLAQSAGHPDVVYTHWPHDLNNDHRVVSQAVLVVFRPPSRTTILTFETLSSTEYGPDPFPPNHFVELTEEHLHRKAEALSCYPGELRSPPHPRNEEGLRVLARMRGSQAGVQYAEAFYQIRRLA